MKTLFLLLFTFPAFADPEEVINKLQAENLALKKEIQELRSELNQLKSQKTADTTRMMEVLQKGKKYQEEQLKALEELEKEE